jgi:glycosyltransferase involved in cell wall biosynthesis
MNPTNMIATACSSTAERAPDQKCLPITVLIAAKDEEANIARCLQSLAPATRVVLIDSASSDNTASIAISFRAEVVNFSYMGGYPKKRQWALDTLEISTPWTMLVDADEQITPELWREIETAIKSAVCTGYLVCKEFHFMGKRFRFGGFSHSAVVLFRTGQARFEQTAGNMANGQDMEVHERVIVDGKIGRLNNPLLHNDYKGLQAYLDRHNKYSTWEAGIRTNYLKTGTWGERTIKSSPFGDPQSFRRFIKAAIIRLPGESWLWFIYHYLIRGGFLEGRRGYIASSIRKAYIQQVRAKMFEMHIKTLPPQ